MESESKATAKMSEKELWYFLYRELAKLKELISAYDKIFDNIEIKENRYNQFFQLILDSLTRSICIILSTFLDKRRGTLSLYRFEALNSEELNKIRETASEFIDLRNNQFGHLSSSLNHKNNFIFLSSNGLNKVGNLISLLSQKLSEVSDKGNYGEGHALTWVGLESSLECMLEDLKKNDSSDLNNGYQ